MGPVDGVHASLRQSGPSKAASQSHIFVEGLHVPPSRQSRHSEHDRKSSVAMVMSIVMATDIQSPTTVVSTVANRTPTSQGNLIEAGVILAFYVDGED